MFPPLSRWVSTHELEGSTLTLTVDGTWSLRPVHGIADTVTIKDGLPGKVHTPDVTRRSRRQWTTESSTRSGAAFTAMSRIGVNR